MYSKYSYYKKLCKLTRRMLFGSVLLLFLGNIPLRASETVLKDSLPLGCSKKLAVLFTNDIHSSGDYARMATLIKQERARLEKEGFPVVLVDGGDIAGGSVYHTLFCDYAFEYVTMSLMGYDAITFGNHDFDFGVQALVNMFETAHKCGVKVPFLVSNLKAAYNNGFNRIPQLKDTLVLQCNGVSVGLFGLMGENAASCILCKDSLVISDRIEAAKKSVMALQKAGADYIICLSHGGTLWALGKQIPQMSSGSNKLKAKTEDGILAHAVPQINAIVSAHDHEVIEKPIIYGHTVIGSAGSKNGYLGEILLSGDSLADYRLIKLSEQIAKDSLIADWVDINYKRVKDRFRKTADNVELDDTIAFLSSDIPLKIEPAGNMFLGALVSDSYREAAKDFTDDSDIVAIVPYGVIRKELKRGPVTNHTIFDMLSLGVSPDGAVLVLAYLSGNELKDICELNASVAGGMEDARLFFSGMSFEYNRYKIPFTRVTKVYVNGKPLEKRRLYPVVTGLYTAKLIGMLKSSSFGLLSAEPKYKDGRPVENLNDVILKKDTLCLTEWLAFAKYAQKNGLEGNELQKSSIDAPTRIVYLQYFIVLAVIILIVWLLLFGRRLLYRQP